MIFEQEYIVFEILDVLSLDQSFKRTTNTNRNFDALSFRYEADTVIQNENQRIDFSDNSIGFFPSEVSYTRISKNDRLIVVHFKAFNYHSKRIEKFIPDESEKYSALFKELLACWESKDVSYKSDCAAILNKIFSELYKDNMTFCGEQKILDSVMYIQKNYLKQNFSLSVAASKSFISEPYFRKLFKKEFNISPKKYVIASRIKYAEALILTNYYTLQEVSEMCGYNDYKHFSTEFKKITGISPSEYNYNYAENTVSD